MNIKDIKVLELVKDINGLAKGTQFTRENGLFVTTINTEKDGEGYKFTRTETRKYSESVIEKLLPALSVVEYTTEYLDSQANTQYEFNNKPFKPRKKIRAQIAEYEKRLTMLENGETKFYSDEDKHEARTVWFNLIKALKWCINEDEQVC